MHSASCRTRGLRLALVALASSISIAVAGPLAAQSTQKPKPTAPAQPAKAAPAVPPAAAAPRAGTPNLEHAEVFSKPWTGDLDGMKQRRVIRAAVTYSRTHYFIEKGVQRGITYDSLVALEKELNPPGTPHDKYIHVAFIPMSREELLPSLISGKADIAAASLTVTPERQALVDFAPPIRTDVKEVVVTAPGVPTLATPEDLSGRQVFIRRSSSYYDSVVALNARLAAAGKPPALIKEAPETLEDEDLLEMVNAGLVKATIVDDHVADLWKSLYTDVVINPGAAVRTGGTIAPAFRKNSPQLQALAASWVKRHGPRSTFSNVLLQKYFKGSRIAKSATAEAEKKRFMDLLELFRKYGGQYELDYVLMAAQGFQESRLDHSVKSPVGAIGVMQVMPATGKDLKVGDITEIEPNIHAGVKYIRFMINQYFDKEPMTPLNKGLFAFAAYNAGPGRVRQLRRIAGERGLDPNVWFNNVERIAAEKIGRETVQYVSNIYKYYIAYTLALEETAARNEAKQSTK